MKKITVFISIIITILVLFTACSGSNKENISNNNKNTKSSYNPFDVDDKNNNTSVSFEFGSTNPVDELIFDGKDIEKEYYYNNSGDIDCKLGFMIFIDGIAQPYRVNGNDNNEIIHEFTLNKKSNIKFKVSFTPTIGQKGNELGMYVVTIFNPTYIPLEGNPIFGNNHNLSQVLPVKVKYLESVRTSELKINNTYTTENVNEEIKKEYLNVSKENQSEYTSAGTHIFHLKYNGEYKESKIELTQGSDLNLTLEALCDPDDAKYRTTVFIDNKQVKINDEQDYLDIQLKKGMLSKQSFSIDIKGLLGSHVLSTVSVPIGNDYSKVSNPVVESKGKLLVIKGEK